ncbi:hypothetical protein ACFX1T_022736 [Malus domestica]
MLPFCLPHLLGGQVREVKMRPRSIWRQRADSSSARDKEKESKRWALGKIEERIRPKQLPCACPPCRGNKQRRMQLVQSNQHKESELKNSRSFNNIWRAPSPKSKASQYNSIKSSLASEKLSVTLFKRKAVESQQARPMITY